MLNDSQPAGGPTEQGEQVIAARDIETTQGLYIPRGSEGTVAEDRGSTLVVFFHHQTHPATSTNKTSSGPRKWVWLTEAPGAADQSEDLLAH